MAVSDMEGRLGLETKDRFPMFREIHCHAAHYYMSLLRAVARTGVFTPPPPSIPPTTAQRRALVSK